MDTINASLWPTLLDLGETGMMIAMILGNALLFVGIGIFMEGWREQHRAQKEKRLVTDRLYGLVRHPQYTGLFIALFGEGMVHWPTILSVVLFPIIVAAFYLLARSEVRDVEKERGDECCAYGFIPRWGQWSAIPPRETIRLPEMPHHPGKGEMTITTEKRGTSRRE